MTELTEREGDRERALHEEARSGQQRGPDDAARGEIEDLARRADRVTSLILYSDLPAIDIDIAANELRELCRRRFGDRVDLFDMVYASRWRRLREQGWARTSTYG